MLDTEIGFQELLSRVTYSSPIVPLLGTLNTIFNGVKVFSNFTKVLQEKERRYLILEYINERDRGSDKIVAYNNTINDPTYEPIINLITNLDELKVCMAIKH